MRNVAEPLAPLMCLFRGLGMLGQKELRRYVWIPLLINLTVYAFGAWLGIHYFSAMLDGLIPAWLEWLRWLLWPLFALLLAAIAFFTFTLLAILIASPFYGPLTQKVMGKLGVSLPEAENHGVARSLFMDLASEVKKMAYFSLRAIPLLLLSVIPGLNIVAPFLWLLFGAWSLSLEYFSYPLEAKGLPFKRQCELSAEHRLESLGFGGLVMLGLSIPLFNIFIPPAAVIGATLYLAEHRRLFDDSTNTYRLEERGFKSS